MKTHFYDISNVYTSEVYTIYILHHDCGEINCLFCTLTVVNAQSGAHCSPYKEMTSVTKSDT